MEHTYGCQKKNTHDKWERNKYKRKKKYKNGSNSLLSAVEHVLYYAGESPTVCLVEIDSLLFRFNNSLRASSLWLWRPGGKRKGSLQLHLWNLNICTKKVNAKLWLAEVTLVMTSLPLAHVFQFFFLHSRLFPLHADWQKSDSSIEGEPQGNWRWNANSRDVVVSSPSFSHPAARAPQRACSQASLMSPKWAMMRSGGEERYQLAWDECFSTSQVVKKYVYQSHKRPYTKIVFHILDWYSLRFRGYSYYWGVRKYLNKT